MKFRVLDSGLAVGSLLWLSWAEGSRLGKDKEKISAILNMDLLISKLERAHALAHTRRPRENVSQAQGEGSAGQEKRDSETKSTKAFGK